nr:MAG TPA: hypothetical protein [Caudoviricetes sp.]
MRLPFLMIRISSLVSKERYNAFCNLSAKFAKTLNNSVAAIILYSNLFSCSSIYQLLQNIYIHHLICTNIFDKNFSIESQT